MSGPRPLTGRRVLLIAIACFGVVLAPNLILAWFAISTFSGLVVENSYVASQGFDRARTAQEALGWTFTVESEADGVLHLGFTDGDGRVVHPVSIEAVIGRPTTAQGDVRLDLQRGPRGYVAAADLDPGNWVVMIAATAEDGTEWRRREPLTMPGRP